MKFVGAAFSSPNADVRATALSVALQVCLPACIAFRLHIIYQPCLCVAFTPVRNHVKTVTEIHLIATAGQVGTCVGYISAFLRAVTWGG